MPWNITEASFGPATDPHTQTIAEATGITDAVEAQCQKQ